jgi:DNA repair exonuclease SbcCD ATPase subunit
VARGPKLDEKLDFALSDRSGAAEDLAGFHLQVATAAWLYGRRGVPWRVIAVDEPFGALDEAHRRSMGVHVVGLLRTRYAFEQAFVIAHDTASTDAMPARIRIIAGRDGSRIEVES